MPIITNKPPLRTATTIYEIKDGILFIERLSRIYFTLDSFREVTNQRLAYTEGFAYPIIIFGKDMISMDKETRDYMGKEGSKDKLSRAFVIEQSQGKLPIQFLLETQEEVVPSKIFDDMESAIEWSKQFRQQ